MQREFLWTDAGDVDMPGAAAAHCLCDAVRAAMLDPAWTARRDDVRVLTRQVVQDLRQAGCEPQAVLLAVKEVLQRASLGMQVDESRLELWRTIIDWTIRDYYRAD